MLIRVSATMSTDRVSPPWYIRVVDDDAEILRKLEEIFGPLPKPPAPPDNTVLDEVLASRSHVRVLRMLALADPHYNFTARALARSTAISHVRTLQVVRHLTSIGMLRAHHTHTHSIYRLSDTHPLRSALTLLFDVEAALPPKDA